MGDHGFRREVALEQKWALSFYQRARTFFFFITAQVHTYVTDINVKGYQDVIISILSRNKKNLDSRSQGKCDPIEKDSAVFMPP